MADYDQKYLKRNPRYLPVKPWRATVWQYGKRLHLGHYETNEEAERRECLEWERYYYGEENNGHG